MPYEDITTINATEGAPSALIYVANQVPIFIPMMLFAIFVITALGSYFSQQRTRGFGDFPASFAVASYITLIVSFVLSLIPGLINTTIIMVCIGMSVVSTLWLFFNKD